MSMKEFDLMNEICEKIAQVAIEIGEMDLTISQFQDKGYKKSARLYADMQLTQLEQLQQLTLFLTGLLIPDTEDKEDAEEVSEESEDEEAEEDTEEDEAPAKRIPAKYPAETHRPIDRRYANAKPVSRKAGYSNGKHSK